MVLSTGHLIFNLFFKTAKSYNWGMLEQELLRLNSSKTVFHFGGRALWCAVALLDHSPLRTVPQLVAARLFEWVTFLCESGGLLYLPCLKAVGTGIRFFKAGNYRAVGSAVVPVLS